MIPKIAVNGEQNRTNSTPSSDAAPVEGAACLRDDPSDIQAAAPSQIEQPEPDTDLALGFLQGLDAEGRHHLTAIRPGNITTASFDAGEQERMRKWIDARQGKANLYYSVNEAKPEARRDSKLTKEEIGTIRALTVDLDPTKVKGGDLTGQHFRRERERLLSVVKSAAADPQCPPTLANDSGGGFQLIWHLKPPVPAEGIIEHVEGIVRTIGARLGSDPSTWNIDRIMRLPGTVNIPSPDKAAQGRGPATATALLEYSGGRPFTLEQLEKWAPPSRVSSKERGGSAKDLRADAGNPVLWGVVQSAERYKDLPHDLRKKFEEHCQRDPKLRALYEDGTLPPGHTDDSGSGYSFALAGRLKQAGDFTSTQFGQLLWVWPYRPEPSKINQRAIWRDWQRAVLEEPWGTPADLWAGDSGLTELPDGVVPKIVERLARSGGRRLGVEPGALAAAYVTALGSLVPAGNRLQMRQFDTDWTVAPILWFMVVGDPATRKSPLLSYAIAPVRAVEARWRSEYAAAQQRPRSVPPAAAEKTEGVPDQQCQPSDALFRAGESVEVGDVPFRQKIVNDATTESTGSLLAENPDGLLYFADELSGWIGSMDAYKARAGKDRPFWLTAKEGQPYTINRQGRGRTVVPNCAVGVLGSIQPDRIRALADNLDDDGLLQRFMPVLIDQRGPGVDEAPDQGLKAEAEAQGLALARSEPNRLFKFAPEADAERLAIEDFSALESERPNVPPAMKQWLCKLPNEFGRLALVFHAIECHHAHLGEPSAAIPELVTRETAHRAGRFLREFVFHHAQAFYGGVVGKSVVEQHARWIAGFILSRRRPVIEARDIYKNYPQLKKPERRGDIAAVMYDLEMQDWVRPIGRGRQGEWNRWAVNPAAHDGRFEDRATAELERRSEIRAMIAETGAERAAS